MAISAADVGCERIFSIADNLYDHRSSYDPETFEAIMIIRAHDQRENINARLRVDLKKESNGLMISQESVKYGPYWITGPPTDYEYYQNNREQWAKR